MTIKLSNYFYFQVPLIHVRVGRLQIANVETIDIQIGIFCQFEGSKNLAVTYSKSLPVSKVDI